MMMMMMMMDRKILVNRVFRGFLLLTLFFFLSYQSC